MSFSVGSRKGKASKWEVVLINVVEKLTRWCSDPCQNLFLETRVKR